MKQVEFLFKIRDEANFRKVSAKVILAEINKILEENNFFKNIENNIEKDLVYSN